jgi:hypothetical protein
MEVNRGADRMSTVFRIALIHATPLAMAPVAQAFERLWPEAQRMNLLDDHLSVDLAARGSLDDCMSGRIARLAVYARDYGAAGILFTCSSFGPAIDAAAALTGLPTLKPNEAMTNEALAICAGLPGRGRIGLVTTFAPATAPMREELEFAASSLPVPPEVACALADGAMQALGAGDAAAHDRLVVEAAASLGRCDVLLLGQFSMARARWAVADAVPVPVLTSPDSAVRALRSALGAER